MREKLILRKNLYLLRVLWGLYSEQRKSSYYNVIGIKDSLYSEYLHYDKYYDEATERFSKRKDKIEKAGFLIDWFIGVSDVFPSSSLKDEEWERLLSDTSRMKGTLQKKIEKELVQAVDNKRDEIRKAYNAVRGHNPNSEVTKVEKYIQDINVKELFGVETKRLESLEKDLICLSEQIHSIIVVQKMR